VIRLPSSNFLKISTPPSFLCSANGRAIGTMPFIKAFKYLKTFRIEENFKTWLYKIALNLAHDHYKRQQQSSTSTDFPEQSIEGSASAEHQIFQSQLLKVVYEILPLLTSRERSIFIMKTMEGLENEEIAKILRISPTTVRRFYGLARRKLLEGVERKLNLSGIEL